MTPPASLADINWSTWQAKDTATLAFVIKDEQILLIRKKRGLGAGKINGPGGRLENNETIAACAVREAQEELGITPTCVAGTSIGSIVAAAYCSGMRSDEMHEHIESTVKSPLSVLQDMFRAGPDSFETFFIK